MGYFEERLEDSFDLELLRIIALTSMLSERNANKLASLEKPKTTRAIFHKLHSSKFGRTMPCEYFL